MELEIRVSLRVTYSQVIVILLGVDNKQILGSLWVVASEKQDVSYFGFCWCLYCILWRFCSVGELSSILFFTLPSSSLVNCAGFLKHLWASRRALKDNV